MDIVSRDIMIVRGRTRTRLRLKCGHDHVLDHSVDSGEWRCCFCDPVPHKHRRKLKGQARKRMLRRMEHADHSEA